MNSELSDRRMRKRFDASMRELLTANSADAVVTDSRILPVASKAPMHRHISLMPANAQEYFAECGIPITCIKSLRNAATDKMRMCGC